METLLTCIGGDGPFWYHGYYFLGEERTASRKRPFYKIQEGVVFRDYSGIDVAFSGFISGKNFNDFFRKFEGQFFRMEIMVFGLVLGFGK